jgi:hypothetical protein
VNASISANGSPSSGNADTGFFGSNSNVVGGLDLSSLAIGGVSGGLVVGAILLLIILKK